MYEQIITKQLYGDRPTREEGIAKLQADYDTWKARQDGIAKLQADYDAWQKAQQPVEAPQIEKPVQKTVRNTPAVEVKAPEEKKKYLTHADVLPTLTKRSADVTQNPEMARLGQGGGVDLFNRPKVATSFVKKAGWDDVGEGQATVYSSTYSNAKGNKAANFTPIVADSQGNYIKTLSQEELEKYAEDVINGRRKDDLKLQIGKTKQGEKAIDDAVKDAERIHELQEDYYINAPKRQKEELKNKNEATSIKRIAKQLNISEAEVKARMQEPKNETFVSPDSVNLASEEEAQHQSDVEKMNKFLDPSKKLTDQEKREAKEVARRILDIKGNPNISGEYDKERTDAVNLMNKTNAFTNFMQGVINPYYRIAKPIDKKIAGAENKAREGVASVLDNIGITENGKEEALREIAERRTEREEKNASMENAYKNAQIQNPLGAKAGNLAGMLSQYYLTNPMFDAAAGALGITGRAGKFLVNQLGQNAQDVALDTLPHYAEYMEDGVLSDEEKKQLKKDAGWNAIGNLIPGLVSEGVTSAKAAKVAKENKAAKAVLENAVDNAKIPDISDMTKWNSDFTPNAQNALYDTSSARKAIDNALNAEDAAKQVDVPKVPEIEAPKIEVPEIEAPKAPSQASLPQETFDKIDSYFEELARPMNEVQNSGLMETVTDEKALKEWDNLNAAYSDYLNKSMFSDNVEEITAAKKTLDNTRKRYARAMKDIDPEVSEAFNSGSYGYRIGRPLNARNTMVPTEEQADEAFELIRELEESNKPVSQSIDNVPQNKVVAESIRANNAPEKFSIEGELPNSSTADDLWDELSGGTKPETPVRTPEMNERGQKLSKLHSTLQNTETLTDAEKQVYADKNGFWYDPDNERKLADNSKREIEDIGVDAMYDRYMSGNADNKALTAQDNHNMFTTSFDYNKMAQEALQNGDTEAAKLYSSKARNIMLKARETGTSYAQFNAATAFYARTPQGYVDKAYQKLGDQISNFKSSKPKLSGDIDNMAKRLADDLKGVDVDGIMAGSDEAAKDSLRQRVLDNIEDYLKTANKQTKKTFSNLSPAELDDIIAGKYQEDLAKNLDMFAMGSFGVKPETVDKVMEIFAEAEKYNINSKQYYDLEKQAFDLLANDLSSGKSFGEKFDTWRYFAMLANPLTHVKNMGGNLNNKLLVGTKNSLAALIEAGADKVAKANGGIEGGRTKALLNVFNANDKALMEGAGKHFDDYAYREFKQAGNKWIDVGRELENAGDVFNGNNKLGRGLNKITKGNENILDAEDILAGKATYQTSLAGFLKANGADASIFTKTDDASRELLEQGKNYALQQANEATFHQKNELAQRISNFIKEGKHSDSTAVRTLSRGLDFMVPFVKTPSNILRACYEYSPLEFLSVAKETKAWKDGTVSTAKYIDDISKGITGSMGMLLGGLLVESGILKVSSGDDTEDSFDKKRGNTSPSIKVGNASLKISELVPGAMPLIIGATVWETIKNSKKSTDAAFDTFFNGIAAIGDSVTDMTMLSGIASTLNDIRYAKTDADLWGQLGMGIASNAAGQVLPTVGRKIEQTIDDTARSTYSGQQGKFLRSLDSDAKYWKTKIPGLQELGEGLEKSENQHIKNIGDFLTNEPQINAWGEEIKNADYNLGKVNSGLGYLGRGVHNTVDLFDTQIDSSNALDKELKNIYHATDKDGNEIKDENVLKYGMAPSTSEATVDGQRMTEKQWTQYQKDSGRMKKELLESFMSSKGYSETSATDKAETLSKLQSFVKAYNQNKIAGKELSSENQQLAELYDKGNIDNVVSFIRTKAALTEAGIDGRSKEAKEAKEAALSGDAEAVNEVIEKTSKANELYSKYNLADDSDAPTVYSKAGEDGLKYYSELKTQGLTNYKAAVTYYNATKEANGSPIPSIKDYATTYKKIDGLIKANGHVDQSEFIAYLNSGGYTEEEARRLASIYGDWKNPPRRYKKKAGWTFDK